MLDFGLLGSLASVEANAKAPEPDSCAVSYGKPGCDSLYTSKFAEMAKF